MTRAHIAVSLLKLGPLTFREFVEITGWPPRLCSNWLCHLRETGLIRRGPGGVLEAA